MSSYSTKLLPILKEENNSIKWDNEFWINNDTWDSLSEERKNKFREIYTEVLNLLEQDFFLHPQMELGIKLITPEKSLWKKIRKRWFKTIAHNCAWVWIGL